MQTESVEGALRELSVNYRILEGRKDRYYLCRARHHAPFNIKICRSGRVLVWSYLAEDPLPVLRSKWQELRVREGGRSEAGLEMTGEGILNFSYAQEKETEEEEDPEEAGPGAGQMQFGKRLAGFLYLLDRIRTMLQSRGQALIHEDDFSEGGTAQWFPGQSSEKVSGPEGVGEAGILNACPDELFARLEIKIDRTLGKGHGADGCDPLTYASRIASEDRIRGTDRRGGGRRISGPRKMLRDPADP